MEKRETDEIRENAEKLANSFIEKGDACGWFEALYTEAAGDHEHIPWADLEPNRFLVEWEKTKNLKGNGRKALVVGCGLGDDAKFLYERGFDVTAFDVSEKAIEWAKKIHAGTGIKFYVADLFNPPQDWHRAFDFVLEVYTIQALPLNLREKTIDAISGFVAENGELIVVQRFRENDEIAEGLPWALSPNDLKRFEENGLKLENFSEFDGDEENVPVKRFVAEYKR